MKFLTLKHWQLFGLLIILPVVFESLLIGSLVSGTPPGRVMYFFPFMMVLFGAFYFGWLYALGSHLHKKLPSFAAMNLVRFKIFIFIPVIYMLLVSGFMAVTFVGTSEVPRLSPAVVALIIPLYIFSIFCIFYTYYFCAKALKTIEWTRPVKFSDFAGEFFLLWFFPVGIWFIQPRINRLFSPDAEDPAAQITEGMLP